MSIYGKNTVGASGWVQIEARRRGVAFDLLAEETALKISAYLRSVGSATNGIRATIYSRTDGSQVAMSAVLAGFTDTVGQWRDFSFTGTLPAGQYWLTVFCDFISGGGNSCEIAYDAVAVPPDPNQESWFNDGTVWPAQTANVTGQDDSDYLHDQAVSIYLQTSAGASPAVLSAGTPSGTIGTQTTATIGATTDQNSGNFYAVVDSAANLVGVTATQIKAGQRASGAAALAFGDVAVSTTSPSVGVTGLVANTAYAYAAIQNNANGDSNILTGTFTTASATAASGGPGGVRARVATLMMT